MSTHQSAGRRHVLTIIFATMAISIMVTYYSMTLNPSAQMSTHIVRLSMTAWLCYMLYLGANWARWIAVCLYGCGGVIALSQVSQNAGNNPMVPMLAMMGVVYVSSALILTLVPSVQDYFTRGS